MDIFDAKITNWKEVNGKDEEILVFRFSDLTQYYSEEELGDEFQYVPDKISELVSKEPGIIAFFPQQYLAKDFGEPFFPKRKYRFPTSSPAPNGTRPLRLLLSSD